MVRESGGTLRTREIEVQVSDEIGAVSALIQRPRGARALYVFAHGAGAGMRHRFMDAMATRLGDRGIATMRYQFPYMEAGRRRPDHRTRLLATVRAAIAEAPRRVRGLPIFAGGKSMGGRMTSQAQAEDPLPRVRGLAFLGFPLHPPGKSGTKRAEHLFEVDVPMLFLQGTRDKLAELELMRPLCRRLGRRARLHIADGADHGFAVLVRSGRTHDEVLDELADAMTRWITRLVDKDG
jgi:predicted alpha/beta-hydrolase family hydrolase